MHEPVAQAGKWLKQVVTGYYQYHAVPGNQQMLGRFRERICRYWRHVLRRRSQKRKPDGTVFGRSLRFGFHVHGLCILILAIALTFVTEGGAVCGNSAPTDLCGGRAAMLVPTATLPRGRLRRYRRLARSDRAPG
jgi:RNA-directed DNA polymerase